MPVISTIVAAIGLTGLAATVATFAVRVVLAIGVSKLMANRAGSTAAGSQDSGARVQLPPATSNKLPVVYGSAFVGPSITDAKISTDQKTMWYVCAFSEVTDSTPGSSLTFDEIYYDNNLVTFGTGAQVASLTTNTQGGGQVDTKVNGNLFIYLFPNGSSSGVNTGGLTAIDIMSDAGIPAGQRWNGSIYTSGGESADMTNTAFAIVKIKYNTDAGTTQLGALTAKITNTVTKPGDVLKDYMLSERYGCGIPLSQIDTDSLDDLNTYSDLPIVYTPMGGGATTTQVRYRIDGPIDTGANCLTNLQYIVDACDSWLQYSELVGKWKVVINQSYTEAGQTLGDLYSVTSSNLIGGVDVNPVDLNATYNQIEFQYPNYNIKDQTDYINISLFDDYPSLLSENEPINKLIVQTQIVNNYVQAKFIAIRRILQSREDLVVNFQTDYSGIQVEAGDIIKVTLSEYGWTDKLFRVNNVLEEKYSDGSLGARLTAFEYNNTIYDDDLDITDFIPEANTGLTDPNIIGTPNAPVVTLEVANTIAQMQVVGNVPYVGLVTNLDFNYGTDSNTANHRFYTTVNSANGEPLVGNTLYTINSGDLSSNTYYWSVTARNRFVGVRSNASNSVSWTGTNVTSYQTFAACNANSSGTLVTSDSIANLAVGGSVIIVSGTGTLVANTKVASVVSNTQFNLTSIPTVALSNACISISAGGIEGNNIQANTITIDNMLSGTNISAFVYGYDYVVADPIANTVTMPININTIGSNIKFESISGNFEKPKYITDVYSGGGGYYPYYTGNSSTTDGYLANSTSAYNPANAAVLSIVNNSLNWHVADYQYVGTTLIPPGQLLGYDWKVSVVANVDCTVQTIPFTTQSGNLTALVAETNGQFNVYNLKANQPQTLTANGVATATGTLDGAGVLIRNFTSSANIIIDEGGLGIFRQVT